MLWQDGFVDTHYLMTVSIGQLSGSEHLSHVSALEISHPVILCDFSALKQICAREPEQFS